MPLTPLWLLTEHPETQCGRAKSPPFERIALLLQGGGALGSYQGGAYQALSEADLHPNWVAGISIGAINAALIAGNPPEKRVEKLRQFWEAVTIPPFDLPYAPSIPINTPPPTVSSTRRARSASCSSVRIISSSLVFQYPIACP